MKNLQELEELFKIMHLEPYRIKQVLQAVFKNGIINYDQIKNLPLETRELLKEQRPILCLTPVKEIISKDQSVHKVAFRLSSGENIEAVLMKYQDGRNSVCLSCQAGCPMGCKFCATGSMGFVRNLTAEEITDQALYFLSQLIPQKHNLTNVVFMGMGEPFLNYDEIKKAIDVLNHHDYFALGSRRLTISTCGIPEGIIKFANENSQVNLAISLHAPNQKIRETIMPVAKAFPLPDLFKAIEFYCQKTNRRVTFEYILLKGVNDSPQNAKELAKITSHKLFHINLIPYNDTNLNNNLKGTDREQLINFQKILQNNGVNVTVRLSMGQDIDAACGQLANKINKS